MKTNQILDFLQRLKKDNTREWMEKHKAEYLQAKTDFEGLINEIIQQLTKKDPSLTGLTAKDCVFRLHRDIRFSKDKTPYKTNFGAAINKGGKKSNHATYYLHLDAEAPFLAGGVYMPTGEVLRQIRQEIDYNAKEFGSILSSKDFKKYFGSMEGDKLKRAPKGYSPEDPNIEWLKHKSYLVMHHVTPEKIRSDDFQKYAVQTFEKMIPFNGFLNRAIDQDFLQ